MPTIPRSFSPESNSVANGDSTRNVTWTAPRGAAQVRQQSGGEGEQETGAEEHPLQARRACRPRRGVEHREQQRGERERPRHLARQGERTAPPEPREDQRRRGRACAPRVRVHGIDGVARAVGVARNDPFAAVAGRG